MKHLLLILILNIFFSCKKEPSFSEQDKENIRTQLSEMEEVDQEFAGIPPEELREKYGNEKAWDIFLKQRDSVSQLHQKMIKKLFEEYGYLGEKKIGEEAANSFWLPIQHADNDVNFQIEMLDAMRKEMEKGSDDKYHYAMLEDRINVNLNKPQRFGSQLTYNERGQAIPINGLVDSTKVDSLRKAFSLPDFKEYYNGMTEMHFEMNKASYLEKGIKEPQFYK